MVEKAVPVSFPDRLARRAQTLESWMVVGLDPDVARFPEQLLAEHLLKPGGLADLIFQFNQAVIRGAEAQALAFKPQIAFYEQYGLEGISALQQTLEQLRGRGLPVILDGKRNDIGSTAAAYANAWLSPTRNFSPARASDNEWKVDALTVSPYLGRDGLRPFLEAAQRYGGGVFILLRTSNPSGAEVQCLQVGAEGGPLWSLLAAGLKDEIERLRGPESGLSAAGFVVGATLPPEELTEIRRALPDSLFLMPGIGVQGGNIETLRQARGRQRAAILPSASRSLLYPAGGKGNWCRHGGDLESWLTEVRAFTQSESTTLARMLHPVLFG